MSGGFGIGSASAAPDGKKRLPGSLNLNRLLSQWLSVHGDGRVTIHPGKVEIGQGILTALAQIAAEELDVALERVELCPATTGESPDEAVTSGSLSVQESGIALRHVCAEARAIFLSVAAQRSGVPAEMIRVEDGTFLGPSGPIGSYWALAEERLLACEATAEPKPKAVALRRIAGTSAPRRDLPEKVFGQPRFLHDLRLPSMLHARVVRPPSRAARLLDAGAEPLPHGARLVRDGSFLAVVAATEFAAEAASDHVTAHARWDERDTLPDAAALPAWLRAAPHEESVVAERAVVDPVASPVVASRLRASFFRPFVAHASIAPSCAVARWDGVQMEVWSHTQGPYNLRADLAIALRLPAEAVVVRHVEGAGCYGHNGADDVALDAALIARQHPGHPVRVLWSRADELGWSPHSPAMLVDVEAGVDAAGRIVSWRQEVISNGHSSRPGRASQPTLLAAGDLAEPFEIPVAINAPLAVGGGAQRNAVPGYAIPDLRVTMRRVLEMPLRSSALRGLGALVNVWAIESVMDRLAARVGMDPAEYRLLHLDDDPRAAAVLRAALEMSDWAGRNGRRAEGVGFGLGVARYKNTGAWCAAVAEIAAEEQVRVRRLWLAADLGEIINPDGAANQLEGGAIQAASIAIKESLAFDRRRVTSVDWDSYPILRFSQVPQVEVRLLPRMDEAPLGAGEASMGPTIAAIAGAVRDALGVDLAGMPFTQEAVLSAAGAGIGV